MIIYHSSTLVSRSLGQGLADNQQNETGVGKDEPCEDLSLHAGLIL